LHDPIDRELRSLMRAHIASYEELDTLLLLYRGGGVRTVVAVAQELNLQPGDVAQVLDRLMAAQLVRMDTGLGVGTFRCEPSSPDLARAVTRLAELDVASRVRLMAEIAIERLRERTTRAFESFSADRAKKGR
jgi:hypothetical protein